MTERAGAHLGAEEVARFLDACGGSELLACEPLERHLRSCPECRGRVVETRLLESHLQRAFTREPVPVDDAAVRRARELWSSATVPVLLPLPQAPAAGAAPEGSAPLDAPVVPLRRRRRLPAQWRETWRRAAALVLRPGSLPLGFVAAGGVVFLLVLAPSRARPPLPVAIPGAVVTAGAVDAPPPEVAPPSTRDGRAVVRRGTLGDSARSASRSPSAALPAARRRATPRDGRERLAAIGDQLPPPLRAAFLGCVVGQAVPDSTCAATVARAQAVVHRARRSATWPPESPAGGADVATDVWSSVWEELNRRTAYDVAPHR